MKAKCILVLSVWIFFGLLPLWLQSADELTPLPPLALGALEKTGPNGEYIVTVWRTNHWQKAGQLAYNQFLQERSLDLSAYIFGNEETILKISQQGGGAAHIDAVLLGNLPPRQVKNSNNSRLLKKLAKPDKDLADAAQKSFELVFSGKGVDKTLKLIARIEAQAIGTTPIQFPYGNAFQKIGPASLFYSYQLDSATPPLVNRNSAGYLSALMQHPPFFRMFTPTGSGHPSGYTYGWVSNDEKNLYVTLDFTPDNTYDGDKDYAKVYVKTGQQVKQFKVSVPETKWGLPRFTSSKNAAYEHKVYDFIIPKKEITTSGAVKEIQLAFAAYGTAALSSGLPNLAYDSLNNRYLLVYGKINGENDSDIYGQRFSADGEPYGHEFLICQAPDDQFFPRVAFDRLNQLFLVVWQHDLAEGSKICGQLVNPNGGLHGPMLEISGEDEYAAYPNLAFDSRNHFFLVVWGNGGIAYGGNQGTAWKQKSSPGIPLSGIFATRVFADGTSEKPFPVNDSEIGLAMYPVVSYDSLHSRFLVAWMQININQYSNPNSDEHGEKDNSRARAAQANMNFSKWFGNTSGAGAELPYLSVIGQLVNSNRSLFNEPFLISSPDSDGLLPALAYDNGLHRFLAAWTEGQLPVLANDNSQHSFQSDRADGSAGASPQVDILGQLIDGNGEFAYDNPFFISNAPGNQFAAAAAFDGVHQHFLTIWTDDRDSTNENIEDIYGQWINSDGQPQGNSTATNFLVAHHAAATTLPSLATNTQCGNFLAAWDDYNVPDIGLALLGKPCQQTPMVETAAISQIAGNTAIGGGNVTAEGEAQVTSRGVCWSSAARPIIADSHTVDGSGLGEFTSLLTGLSINTTYHVRAYATNSFGTAYGNELTFTTFPMIIDLTVSRETDKAWIIQREYGLLAVNVQNPLGLTVARYVIYRKAGNGEYQAIKDFLPSDLQDGAYQYADKYLDPGSPYTYKVAALDAAGMLIGISQEKTI